MPILILIITKAGTSLLVPTVPLLNETNAISGYGSLGLAANNCNGESAKTYSFVKSLATLICTPADWQRPPNFLLVDFYNQGSSPGSVFEVAAQLNNVTYNQKCCGLVQSTASSVRFDYLLLAISLGVSGIGSLMTL